jgi:hypothetical protein
MSDVTVMRLDVDAVTPAVVADAMRTVTAAADVVLFARFSEPGFVDELAAAGLDLFVIDEAARKVTPLDPAALPSGKVHLVCVKGAGRERLAGATA